MRRKMRWIAWTYGQVRLQDYRRRKMKRDLKAIANQNEQFFYINGASSLKPYMIRCPSMYRLAKLLLGAIVAYKAHTIVLNPYVKA